ncbi:hypothetical protein BGX38DRAFT_155084 [Terfezia claveryi]|nr:hypothetical protein BGX38DRAFT_155084 [Terfezia claveryi]
MAKSRTVRVGVCKSQSVAIEYGVLFYLWLYWCFTVTLAHNYFTTLFSLPPCFSIFPVSSPPSRRVAPLLCNPHFPSASERILSFPRIKSQLPLLLIQSRHNSAYDCTSAYLAGTRRVIPSFNA